MTDIVGEAGTPWYASGLRFRCTACGECCTGAPGYVWVEREELAALAKAKGLPLKAFTRRYVRKVGRRLSIRERENGDCEMLGPDGRCLVYVAKPIRCSTFPFWTDVLETPEEWEATAEVCEGIGEGDLYTAGEIARIAGGDPKVLLENHARPAAPVPSREGVREEVWAAALADLDRLYADLEAALPRYRFTCSASGRCCDFDAHGHRLYASSLEAEAFFRRAPKERSNEDARQCPAYGSDRLCHAREGRMLGCRVYFCPPYPAAGPEDLYERYHRRLKAIHDRHGIPFSYKDIIAWAAERRPASK